MRKLFLLVALLSSTPIAAQTAPPTNVTMENGQPRAVTPTAPAAPLRASSTVTASAIVAANTFQSVLLANNRRLGCLIVNRSLGTMQVYLGAPASATSAASIPLPSGGTFNCATAAGLVITDQISVSGGTAGDALVIVTQ